MSFQEPQDDLAEEFARRRERLQFALQTGTTLVPDTVATDRREASARGMPVDTYVAARQQNVPLPPPNWESLPDQFPELTAMMSRPENAAVAHDDIETLSGIEGALRFTGDLGRRAIGELGGGFGSMIAGGSRYGERIADRLGAEDDGTVQRLFRSGIEFGARAELGGRNLAGTTTAAERANLVLPLPAAGETGFAGDVSGALGQMGGQIIGTVATGGVGGALLMTAQGGRQMDLRIQEDMARDGRTERTAADDIALGAGGAFTYVTEKLGLDAVFGRLPPAVKARMQGVLSRGLVGLTGEASSEAADTVGQNLLAAGLLGEDVAAEEGAAEAAGVGGVAGFIAATTVALLTPGRGRSQARAEAEAAAAEDAARTFQDLTTLSEASRLREREPATFQQFVEQVTENGPLENIYVEAETFAQSLNEAGVSLDAIAQAIPSLAEQLPNALATGGDLRITAGEYATHLANSDAGAGLLQHLRANAYGMSQAQAKEFMATKGEALQAEVEAAVAEATANEELTAGRERVRAKITEDLNAAGRFTNDVNAAYSSLPAAFYDVMAKRTGMTAEELAQKYQLRYAAELPSSTGRQVMDQDETIDLIHFSSTPGIKMSDPSRWGAAGVTQVSERERRNAGAPGRTYFGVQGVYNGEPETGIGGRSFRYRARVPASKLYDFDADPQNLRPTEGTATEIATAYEKAIQEAGFSGYRSDAAVRGAVALFEPTSMEMAGPIRTMQDAQRLSARMRELAYQDFLARAAAKTNPNEVVVGRSPEDFRDQALADLFPGATFDQTATVRGGRETLKKYGLDPNKKYRTREVAAALEARQRAKYGTIEKDDRSPEAVKKIANWIAEEVLFEMQNPEQSGVGWYSTKFRAALDIFAQEFPELATDPDARDTFTALIAITSDGQKVVPNFQQAAGIYRAFKTDGRFVADQGTMRQSSVDNNLAKLQELYDNLGPKGMREFLMSEATVSQLKKQAKEEGIKFSTGYKADVRLPQAAVIFGPKLGAFYANLMGADGYLTMDRWWSRTFNRYRGTLLAAATPQGLARFKVLVSAAKGLNEPPSMMSDDQALAYTVEYKDSYAAKGYKNGTEIEKAANTLYKAAFENLEDQPFNAGDRSFMLETVALARKSLKRRGVDISVADIQAVLWYYEKRLYGELGARQSADVSYEEAAQRVVDGSPVDAELLGPDLDSDWEGSVEQADAGLQVFNQGPAPRTVAEYFSPENLGSLLEKDDWTILTAANPMGQSTSQEQNDRAMARLKADLDAAGYDYEPSIGSYGMVEPGFTIVGITEAQARALGEKYNQASVLTRKGLIYRDGRVDAATGVTQYDTRPKDYFTEIPSTGALFQVDLDFERRAFTKGAAFKDWFGDSKVVDESGEPLVVYHGTGVAEKARGANGRPLGDVDAFDRLAAFNAFGRREGMDAVGVWFSEAAGDGSEFAGAPAGAGLYAPREGGAIYPVFLSIKNPYRPASFDEFLDRMHRAAGRDPKTQSPRGEGSVAELRAELVAEGYDGIYFEAGVVDDKRAAPVWVAFEPEQIKSVNNRGSFDPNAANILFQSDPFYSALERAIATEGPESATPAEWKRFFGEPESVKRSVKRGPDNKPMMNDDGTPVMEERVIPGKLRAGLRQEELDLTGVKDWLDAIANGTEADRTKGLDAELVEFFSQPWTDAEGKVSKENVLAFVRAGGVQLEEAVLGELTEVALSEASERQIVYEVERALREFDERPPYAVTESDRDDGSWTIYNRDNGMEWRAQSFATEAEAAAFAAEQNAERRAAVRDDVEDYARRDALENARESQAGRTQYDSYSFADEGVPGSYREFLLRMPTFKGKSFESVEQHFGGFSDILGFVQLSEHTDANGKRTMFLSAVQGTHHQAGRDKGYEVPADPATVAAAQEAYNAALERQRASWPPMVATARELLERHLERFADNPDVAEETQRRLDDLNDRDSRNPSSAAIYAVNVLSSRRGGQDWSPEAEAVFAEYNRARLAGTEASSALNAARGVGGVADAPWKKSWDTLLMKRMIRYAADNGFEQIAWINGNQQNGGKTGGDGSFFYERNLVNATNDIIKKYGSRVGPVDMRAPVDREAIIADRASGERQRREMLAEAIAEVEANGPDGYIDYVGQAQERLDRWLAMTETALTGEDQNIQGIRGRIADIEALPDSEFRTKRLEEETQLLEQQLKALDRPRTSLGIQNGFLITPELAEAARAGFALFQKDDSGNRGQIAFGADITQTPSVISLLRKADLSTFIHETGHFFLEATADMANATDAPPDIVADMATILNWMRPGMTLADWNTMSLEQRRPFHEKWARGFEAYHFEGKSPSLALVDQFRRFSAWLKNVYRSLTDLDVELTDDVRGVMDRMLASEAEITEMEQLRGLTPSFTSKPEFASEDEWEEYQRLAGDATATAIEQLEQRSARDMRWASGAKDRYLRQLQREGEEQRKAIRAEVTAEVMAEPVNRARAFLRRGLGENGQPVEDAAKLDLATLKALYGDAPARPAGPVGLFAPPVEGPAWTKLRRGGKYAEVGTDGLHPDTVATMFGYRNGEALIDDLVNGEDSAEKIKGLTDQRMLERYGDLADAQSIERAANEAVANEARAKFVQAEMAMAEKAIGKRSILNSAAKLFANSVVNRLEMRRLRPAQYIAAQARAAKTAEKALRNDDLPGFAAAKRNQLINLHTGHAVQKAQKDGEKTMRLFTRIVSAKDDSIGRSRDMNLVNAARAILALHGIGRVKNDPIGYMDLLKEYDPTLYADLAPFIENARVNAKPVDQLTYEQFQALRDTVNQLWALSKRTKQMEIDGQMIDRERVSTELRARLEQLRKPGKDGGYTRAPTPRQRFTHMLLGLRAAMTRVETWARGTDPLGEQGPFTRYIWNPISEAADRYTAESGDYTRRLRALLETVRDDMGPRDIKSPEIGHIFNGKMELLHALLHSGNASNKSKLLLGWKWGKLREDGSLDDSRWQAMLDRMHADGTITERDWIFVQSVWDLLEETKPGAQRAHFAIYGRYFDEVSADPVITPFGELRGGYVPALTDTLLVQDAALRAEQEAIEGGDSAMFPAASNGFTKARKENYNRELALNLGLLSQHLDKVLRFTHLGPPVRDVARLLKDKGFSKALQDYDPSASTELLLPWLQRSAKQLVETPMKGSAGKGFDRFFNGMRRNVGMQLMFANVVNTAQQLTGMTMATVRVKPHRLADALWAFTRDPKGVSEAALAQSQLLTNRANTDIFEARQAITEITKLDPNALDQAQAFAMRHAYVLQSALQNQMDVVIWTGAFNQAMIEGQSERNAARFADSVIRETQHSMTPTDIARFETGHPVLRIFTQFAGYFNMAANLGVAEFRRTIHGDLNFRQKAGRLFYVYLNVVAIPAFIGEAIAVALRGGLEDDEGDGYIDELLAMFIGSQFKFALAAVPIGGTVVNAIIGTTTEARYDDRLSLSPAVSVIEGGLGVPYAIYQGIVEGKEFNRQDVRNTANLLGVMTGLPIGALGRPVGYAVGVAQGEIQPTSTADAVRGAITGVPSPESKTQ